LAVRKKFPMETESEVGVLQSVWGRKKSLVANGNSSWGEASLKPAEKGKKGGGRRS